MKIRFTLKTPDVLDDTIAREVEELQIEDEDDKYCKIEELKEACAKWFKWGEIVTIEVDTDTDKATVIRS